MATGCTFCEAPLTGSEMYCHKCGMSANSPREQLSALREVLLVKVLTVPSVGERPAESNNSKAFAAGQRFSHLNLSRIVKYGGGFLIAVVVLGLVGNYWVRTTRPSKNDTQTAQTKQAEQVSQVDNARLLSSGAEHGNVVIPIPLILSCQMSDKIGSRYFFLSDGDTLEQVFMGEDNKLTPFMWIAGTHVKTVDSFEVHRTASYVLINDLIRKLDPRGNNPPSQWEPMKNRVDATYKIIIEPNQKATISITKLVTDGVSQIKGIESYKCSNDSDNVEFRKQAESVRAQVPPQYLHSEKEEVKPSSADSRAESVNSGLKIDMAYLCTGGGFEEITRIFQSDGSVFELWSKKQKTAPDLMFIGNWKFSKNDKSEIVLDRVWQQKIANGNGGNLEISTRNSEAIVVNENSPLVFRLKTGAQLECVESPGATQQVKQFAHQADTMLKAAQKSNREMGLCTKPNDQEEAKRQTLAAREAAIAAIAKAKYNGGRCNALSRATVEPMFSNADDGLNNLLKLFGAKGGPDAAMWNLYCGQFVNATKLFTGECR